MRPVRKENETRIERLELRSSQLFWTMDLQPIPGQIHVFPEIPESRGPARHGVASVGICFVHGPMTPRADVGVQRRSEKGIP